MASRYLLESGAGLIALESGSGLLLIESSVAEGALNVTLANATLAAAGSITNRGSLSATLANFILAATGSLTDRGALGVTLADTTLVATGTVGGGTINGSLNVTLADATLAATGSLTDRGALTATLAPVTLTATGSLTNRGALGITLGDVTLSASGIVSQGAAPSVAPIGGWLSMSDAFERQRAKSRRLRRQREEEIARIDDDVTREIATIIHADEVQVEAHAERRQVREIARAFTPSPAVPQAVTYAWSRAEIEQTALALEAFRSQVARMLDEEEGLVLALMHSENFDGPIEIVFAPPKRRKKPVRLSEEEALFMALAQID